MGKIEFMTINNELWYSTENSLMKKLEQGDKEIIETMITEIKSCYPEAYLALRKEYFESSRNFTLFKYLIVRRFCKCNFGNLDTTKSDLDNGRMNFEKVSCPLRGECKYENIICCPKFSSTLSKSELGVMKLYYDGLEAQEIADTMYLSIYTIKNHIKSVYAKLGIHEKAEFVKYANEHDLFVDR